MHESSLFNEMGDQRPEFALADLFGASYLGEADHTARWPEYLRPVAIQLQPHVITDDPVIKSTFNIGSDNVDYIGMASKIKARPGRQVIANLKEQEPTPFLMISEHGKGKVAYFAADIGQSYFTTRINMNTN